MVLENITDYLSLHEDQPLWIRGVVLSLLLIALLRWGHAAFALHPCGASIGQNGVNGRSKHEKATSADSNIDSDLPLQHHSNEHPALDRQHSQASGMTDSPGDADDEAKRPACGLAPGWTSKQVTVEKFASALQRMIINCRREREKQRIRIFDDCTVNDTMEGSALTLTECRCTQFKRLRTASRITEEEYCQSMCDRKFTGGKVEASGKSGSFFMRTYDGKFVLKTIEEHEFVCLKDVLPHMVLFLEAHMDSLLCRFLGAYSLEIGGNILRFVVMSNVFPLPQKPTEVYDLKGTTEDRWVNPTPGCTLKDNNFGGMRLLFDREKSAFLSQQVTDDAEFLWSLGVMDYSLLVGVTPHPEGAAPKGRPGATAMSGWLERPDGKTHYVFQMGIIDYLQRWTPKKVAAHWLKKATLGCYHEIDTEPPAVYCKRFCKYFFHKIQPIAH